MTADWPSVQGVNPEISLVSFSRGTGGVSESVVITNTLSISGISPHTISTNGGTVTISGSGFDSSYSMTFGTT